jgi:hypothetical protein
MVDLDCWSQEKVFCIGLNKTGTTSLEKALGDLGYRMGSVPHGERLLKNYLARDFSPIIEFCKTADAFQDIPFSLPYTYVLLDHYFKNAKFILSVRDTPEQWYRSLVTFHSNAFFAGKRPTEEMLREESYRYKGFMWDGQYGVIPALRSKADPYDMQSHLDFYNAHNESVRVYFNGKANMLELNLAQPGSYLKMCEFLGKQSVTESFPWLNRSTQ